MRQELCPESIRQGLNTAWAGQGQIAYAEEMPSTNGVLRELARQGAPHGSLAVCHHQTAGKGRIGRSWETPPGQALTQSLLLRPRLKPEEAQLCTFAAALAAVRAIKRCCPGLEPGVKWPNDVVIGSGKCAGILSEMGMEENRVAYVVTGVGLNVNQLDFPQELREKATSLLMEMRRENPGQPELSRPALLRAYLEEMEALMNALESRGFDGIREEYEAVSVTLGRCVQVIAPAESYTGIAKAVDDTGALLVSLPDGSLRTVLCGDVSVRGLMGYV